MNIVHLDFEGRSGVDITDVGSHRFSIDPRFEIMLAGVSRDDEDRVYQWVNPIFQCIDMMGENDVVERMLAEADLIYAHNAPNELANIWGALSQGKACPVKTIPSERRFRCTAAMARKAGMPASLDGVCQALDMPIKKDRRGKALINLFCMPDEDTGEFVDPVSRPDDWVAFGEYNITDVQAEKGVHRGLKAFELTGLALEAFLFDLRMNQRGIPINLTAAKNAQQIIDEEQAGVSQEFRAITGLNPTQRKKLLPWFKETLGVPFPNLQAQTVETFLETQLTERQRHVIGLYQKVSYSAVAKISKMLECACPDGKVRGGHLYYGAGTGRWSGKLLQPQNFKKCPVELKHLTTGVYSAVCNGWSREMIDQIYGNPLEMLSICIRHFIHDPSLEMLDGDFNAVEARIICWLANEAEALEEYRLGKDRYMIMAADVYEKPLDYIKSLGKDSTERQVGKHTVLGCGFGLGRPEKFQDTVWKQGGIRIDEALAEKCIRAFRKKHRKIVAYWYQLDEMCKNAVRHPGSDFGPFRIRKIGGIPYLLFRLRSGRSLAYPHPQIELFPFTRKRKSDDAADFYDTVDANWNPVIKPEQEFRENVTYWGQIPGTQHWGRIKLYGGKLSENEAQATAADFMAHGAIIAENRGMPPFMLVHDQGLALRNRGQTTQEYERALGDLPPWAKDFPMKVEAKITKWYTK